MQDTAGTRQRMEQFSNADNPDRIRIRDAKYRAEEAHCNAMASQPQGDIDYDTLEAIALMDVLDEH